MYYAGMSVSVAAGCLAAQTNPRASLFCYQIVTLSYRPICLREATLAQTAEIGFDLQ
jgi:hypothetical protein